MSSLSIGVRVIILYHDEPIPGERTVTKLTKEYVILDGRQKIWLNRPKIPFTVRTVEDMNQQTMTPQELHRELGIDDLASLPDEMSIEDFAALGGLGVIDSRATSKLNKARNGS
jgi:hypothetical protein